MTTKKMIESLEKCYKYSNIEDGRTLVPQKLVLNIINFLKKQVPKVVPFNDIIKGTTISNMWIEDREYNCTYPYAFGALDPQNVDYYRCEEHHIGEYYDCSYYPTCQYNKTWRVWTERPTIEQREAEKWNV